MAFHLMADSSDGVAWKPIGLATGLSVAAGFVDGNTKSRFDTFGGMQTGNTVLLGIALQQWSVIDIFLYSVMVLCFVFGVMLTADVMASGHGRWAIGAIMATSLIACDALAALTSAHQLPVATRFTSAFAAISMGAQNALSMKDKLLQQNTTIVTGNLQKLAELGHRIWRKSTKEGDRQLGLQLGLAWLGYVLGASVGAASAAIVGNWSLWPAALVQNAVLLSLHRSESGN